MKTVRPQYTPPMKVATEKVVVGNEIITQEYSVGKDEDGVMYQERRVVDRKSLLDEEPKKEVETKQIILDDNMIDLMNQTIEENKIKVEIILTKRQHELWLKKGGEKWLKQIITGRILNKKGKRK